MAEASGNDYRRAGGAVREAAGDAPAAIPLPRAHRRLATLALMLAAGMQAADATIVNVALPRIEADLGGGIALGAWVMTSYLCAAAVFAPLAGWLRRRFGAQRLFACAVGLFIIASLGCALAPSKAALIGLRLLQGAAGGIVHPMTQAILLDLYPKRQHGRMLGVWGATTMVGPILGPALGGIITDAASWHWVFVINLPLGLLALWGAWRALAQNDGDGRAPIDGIGLVLLVAGVGALQLFLERGVGRSWLHSPELMAETIIAVVAVAGLALRARQSRLTIIRPDVLLDLNFAAAAFYNFTTSALLFTALVLVPALAEGPLGYDAATAGATLVPRAVLMMLTMLLAGRLIGRVGFRVLLAIGCILMTVGLLLLSDIQPQNGLLWIIAGSTIQAIGAGLLFTPLSTLAFATLDPSRRTDAAGLYSLLRQLGCASGVALMTAVWRHLAAANAPQLGAAGAPLLTDAAALHAYGQCFRLMAIVSLAMIPGVFLFRVSRLPAAAAARTEGGPAR